MPRDWAEFVRRYRLRHGLTQGQLATVMGVSQRTVSRWERSEDTPNFALQRRLRDLGWEPPDKLIASLALSVRHCPVPRALSRTPRLQLQAVSAGAILKRPSIVDWIGLDLVPIARGVLQEMLDDAPLQRSIAKREIACIVATTRGVLGTGERQRAGTFRTTISYFFQDGMLYSDAISAAGPPNAKVGYQPIAMDDAV
jgi:transcriptional regulator with XRE-family HTH domain